MRLAWVLALALASSSCLDGGSNTDASANVDMRSGIDIAGLDLTGSYNCVQLNMCTNQCRNLMCVAACREKATPSALFLEGELQKCFNMYCPQESDMASPICKLDPMTGYSQACLTCIANTQKASAGDCNPPGAPECTKCFAQAQACKAD